MLLTPRPCTDLGNARRLVDAHGDDLLYVPQYGRWLVWDGKRWAIDETGEIERRAKVTAEAIADEAKTEGDRRKELQSWWRQSESEARLRAMVNLATTEPDIPVTPAQLDTQPLALNLRNGTLDLETGQLHEHDPANAITKLAPVIYDPNATAPLWFTFLERIFDGNTEMIRFVQRAVGYALTALTSEQVFFILYGRGGNGKTTFIETIRALLGEYAAQADFSTFLTKQGHAVRNDLARLAGVRFVSAAEAEQGCRLSESVVKQVTGGDTITTRFLYREYFEYRPGFKLFLAANHKPTIRGTDHAIWRRIRLVPFTVTIPSEEQDRELLTKLRAELPGILQWAIGGCLAWQREGLGQPESVQTATREYRRQMDELVPFIDDCCIPAPGAKVGSTVLYTRYREWAEEVGEAVLSQRKLGTLLGERGFESRRSGKGGKYEWHGLGLNHIGPTEPIPTKSPSTDSYVGVSLERVRDHSVDSVADGDASYARTERAAIQTEGR